MWTLAYFLIAFVVPFSYSIDLEGSQTSYAKYQKWNPCANASLSLELKTRRANGLILYTDDGGNSDFFELKMVQGSIRLRVNLARGATILSAGSNMDDDEFHKVAIVRNDDEITLKVGKGHIENEITRTKKLQGYNRYLGGKTQHNPTVATFDGEQYLIYNLSNKGDPILSTKDRISLYFKTRQSSGLLFFTDLFLRNLRSFNEDLCHINCIYTVAFGFNT
ncbi:neurexin 1-like [Tubulanus polymorphus]|uniref:neurexin 1-like n=1 Tax=Tubulanus polymorphus TaxID=672921 RepID=UPI003DA1FF45